jgi:hypothetical protein
LDGHLVAILWLLRASLAAAVAQAKTKMPVTQPEIRRIVC